MASLFVSHSSRDRVEAERVVERLRAEGFTALFIDFDPDQGIPAGRSWERELYAQLRKTDGVIFLASAASVASSWCFAEVSLARSLGKPVFPLRLEATPDWPCSTTCNGWTWRRARPPSPVSGGPAASRSRPVRRLRLGSDARPYPGLEPFGAEDAAVFFGREQEIDRLLELLQPTLQRGAGRFVAIVGPSGSGKSSLLRAGLLPRLQRLDERWVLLPPLVPGQRPTESLARSLARAFATCESARAQAELRHACRWAPALVELADEIAEANGGGQTCWW